MTPARRAGARAPGARSQRQTPKVVRWVDLLAFLLRHTTPVTWDDIRVGVPDYARHGDDGAASAARMFERDKDDLRTFGVPIAVVRVPGSATEHYRLERAAFYLPYLQSLEADAPALRRVSREFYRTLAAQPVESSAVELVRAAAARVRAAGDPVLAEQVDGALRKLAIDLPHVARAPDDDVALGPRTPIDEATIAIIADALAARRRLVFAYESIDDGTRTRRTVAPYGLVQLQGQWYLVAHDPSRGDGVAALRRFRVSRMREVVADASAPVPQFEVLAGFDIAEHARVQPPWALGDGATEAMTYEVVRPTGAARGALDEGDAVAGYPMRRTVHVRRREVFVRWLLAFGGAVRPVAPASLVDEWRAALARMRAQYAEVPA